MIKAKLFLQWALINSLVIVGLIIAYQLWWPELQALGGASKMVFPILVIFGVASVYAGRLCWRADKWLASPVPHPIELNEVKHDTEHVWTVVQMLPFLGMLASVAGLIVAIVTGFDRIQSGSSEQTIDALRHVADGVGAAMLSTFVALLGALVLWYVAHNLTHAIDSRNE